MPKFVIKADPEQDFYVAWSTVVDAPTMWGTKEQMLHDKKRMLEMEFIDKYEYESECLRYDRADETGTSQFGPNGAWGDNLMCRWSWVDDDLQETGDYTLPRDKVYQFVVNEDNSVLLPMEDED